MVAYRKSCWTSLRSFDARLTDQLEGYDPRCYSLTGGHLLRFAGPGLPGPVPSFLQTQTFKKLLMPVC